MTDHGSEVHPLLRNTVIAVIWATVLIPAFALVTAISVYAVRLGVNGNLQVPDIGLAPQTQMLVILGALGLYGFIVWMAMRETFGDEDVDRGVDAAVDATEQAQTLRNNDDN